jgi:hypothetical protein
MKILVILFTLFYFLNALAVAPYGFKGQHQSTTLYSNVLQAPNNLVTNLGGINGLMETGNNNILSNPSFEHLTFDSSWTNAGIAVDSAETTNVIHGKKAVRIDASSETVIFRQDSSLYAAQFADGVQGLVSVRIKSDVALKVCSRQAGTTSTSNCVDVVANNKWGLYKVPFILGATSNGISIASSGAVTGTVYIDDAFVGAVDLQATVDASKIAGEAYFAGTAGCNWSRTSTTIGDFTATAACPGPTIEMSSMGQWQTTDADLPQQTINNLPAGNYLLEVELVGNYTLQSVLTYAISDGTTVKGHYQVGMDNVVTPSPRLFYSFNNPTTQNKTFKVVASNSAGGAVNISNATSSQQLRFRLLYFGSGSVYSSTNADFWGRTYSPTITSDTGALSNFTSTATYGRQGNRLHVKGRITFTGASSAFTCPKIGLPENLTLASSDSEILGDAVFLDSSAARYVKMDTNTLVGLTNSVRISYPVTNTGTNPQSLNYTCSTASDPVVIASGDYYDYSFEVPVNEWQQSNIIIGQFNGLESCTNTLECTDTFSAKVTITGTVVEENIDWLSGNCSNPTTGTYNCTVKTGIFTVAPNCTATTEGVVGSPNTAQLQILSATSINAFLRNTSNGVQSSQWNIICQKQGVDYIGKTAKAVASDQNLRTPGVTKGVVYSAFIGAAGTIVSELGDFISGSCTVASTNVYTCNFNAGIFASDPFCQLTVMGASGAARNGYIVTNPTTSSITYLTYNTSGATPTALNAFLTCHGVSP